MPLPTGKLRSSTYAMAWFVVGSTMGMMPSAKAPSLVQGSLAVSKAAQVAPASLATHVPSSLHWAAVALLAEQGPLQAAVAPPQLPATDTPAGALTVTA